WDMSTFDWIRNEISTPVLDVENSGLQNASTSPRLEVTVTSNSLVPVSNIQLTALLFDTTGTVYAASRTYVDTLLPTIATRAVFSWPASILAPASTQIIPITLPDRSYIR